MKIFTFLFASIVFFSCNSNENRYQNDSSKTSHQSKSTSIPIKNSSNGNKTAQKDSADTNNDLYLQINNLWIGRSYTNKTNNNVFFRIIQVQQEEDIKLIAEQISTGQESGRYKLIKRINITPAISKYGFSSVDSLKFIDSVSIQGFFDKKKVTIDLDKL